MSTFRPYWMRHPHQLRAFSFVMMFAAPIMVPVLALWAARWDLLECFTGVYRDLWQGLTHRIPAKPIIRPLLGFLAWWAALALPGLLLLVLFHHFASNAPVWAVLAVWALISADDVVARAHERKKYSDKALADGEREQLNNETSALNRQRMAREACSI